MKVFMKRLVNNFIFLMIILVHPLVVCADVIYQWTDPWGQRQYSKTPVPGAMISDLKELPEVKETTEQQKQEAMFSKLQQMRQMDMVLKQENLDKKNAQQNQRYLQKYCTQLQNTLMDVQLNHARNFSLLGHNFLSNNYYLFIETDISREIRRNCR